MGPFIFLVGWGRGGGGDFCLFFFVEVLFHFNFSQKELYSPV